MTADQVGDWVRVAAGRDLDALVAEKVMGLQPCSDPVGRCEAAHMTPVQCWGNGGGGSDLESYSVTISAAWDVFETALCRVGTASISADMENWGRGTFFGPGPERVVTVTIGEWSVTAPVCEAICRAALLAVAEVSS